MGLFSKKPNEVERQRQEFQAAELRRQELEQSHLIEAQVWVDRLTELRNGAERINSDLLGRAGDVFDVPYTGDWQGHAKAANKIVMGLRQNANIEMQFAESVHNDPEKAQKARLELIFWASVMNHLTAPSVIGPQR